MGSTFGGIEIGKKALQAQQKAMNVTGHNIANANNENYSRQRAIQSATDPHPYPALYNNTGAGQIGTGVEVSKIERIRDQFVDQRLRGENQDLGKWSMIKEKMKEVERESNYLTCKYGLSVGDEEWTTEEVAQLPTGVPAEISDKVMKYTGVDKLDEVENFRK